MDGDFWLEMAINALLSAVVSFILYNFLGASAGEAWFFFCASIAGFYTGFKAGQRS